MSAYYVLLVEYQNKNREDFTIIAKRTTEDLARNSALEYISTIGNVKYTPSHSKLIYYVYDIFKEYSKIHNLDVRHEDRLTNKATKYVLKAKVCILKFDR